jgi:hypothetical protein
MINGLEREMIGIQSLRWCCKGSRGSEFMLLRVVIFIIKRIMIYMSICQLSFDALTKRGNCPICCEGRLQEVTCQSATTCILLQYKQRFIITTCTYGRKQLPSHLKQLA